MRGVRRVWSGVVEPWFALFLSQALQFGVLLVGEFECDLSGLLSNHHVENVAILERLGASSAASEFDQRFVRGETRSAWQRRAHAIGVEEDHIPGVPVPEGHENAVLSRLRRGQLHKRNCRRRRSEYPVDCFELRNFIPTSFQRHSCYIPEPFHRHSMFIPATLPTTPASYISHLL
jgi:hypothetical protein